MSDYRAMSTNTSAQREAPPDPSDVLISTATKDLLADRDLTVADLSYNAGIPISTLYRKLNGAQAWKASDISRVARYFGVPVGDLFSGRPPVGRGRRKAPQPAKKVEVRHQGLEPRTRWFEVYGNSVEPLQDAA
jgi:hypothetical protein